MHKNEQNSRHEKWQAIIKEQEASGLSQAQFCKEHNISAPSLVITAAYSNQSSRKLAHLHLWQSSNHQSQKIFVLHCRMDSNAYFRLI
jgi:hypothetical protein